MKVGVFVVLCASLAGALPSLEPYKAPELASLSPSSGSKVLSRRANASGRSGFVRFETPKGTTLKDALGRPLEQIGYNVHDDSVNFDEHGVPTKPIYQTLHGETPNGLFEFANVGNVQKVPKLAFPQDPFGNPIIDGARHIYLGQQWTKNPDGTVTLTHTFRPLTADDIAKYGMTEEEFAGL